MYLNNTWLKKYLRRMWAREEKAGKRVDDLFPPRGYDYMGDGGCGHLPYARDELNGKPGKYLYCHERHKSHFGMQQPEDDCYLVRRRRKDVNDPGAEQWQLVPENSEHEEGYVYKCRRLRKLPPDEDD